VPSADAAPRSDVTAAALRDLGTPLAPQVEPSDASLAEHNDIEVLALPFTKEAGEDDEAPRYVLGPGAAELFEQEGSADPFLALERASAGGAAGDLVELPRGPEPDAPRVLLLGLGAGTPADCRRAGAALARRLKGVESVATSAAAAVDEPGATALVEGLVLGSFTFSLKTGETTSPVRRVLLAEVIGDDRRAAVRRGVVLGLAGWRSRTLALVPSNIKGPSWLADQAVALAADRGLDAEVWDEDRLAGEGFGGLLGVGQASDRPPRLVRLGYTPEGGGREAPHVVLVGKGITFDSGGLSLKPAEGMTTMKRDMTGAGVVLSVLAALAEVGCTVRVTGLMACAENAVSGRSLRPGDVLGHYGGRTSEVTNTDAEGRLVLADALAYAAARLEPTVLVDVATLTGAGKVALGQRTGALFANDDRLARALLDAGDEAGEPLWRLPLAADYEERLESRIADVVNAPSDGPGAITAALFLQHHVAGLPWAHLDIASVGDSPVDAHEWTSGATGFGARLLLRWLSAPEPAGLPVPVQARRKR
jgi:leucyl aminopeptidase